MNIGQFADTFLPVVDGVGRVVYNYATTLCQKGHECYVIAPMVHAGYRGGYPFELVDYWGMPVPGSSQYSAGISILDRHYDARIHHIRLDIAHAHTPFTAGMEALRVARRQKIPLVGTFHSKYYDDFYQATGTALLASIGVKVVVEFYEHCDEVWAVSASSAQVLRDYGYKGNVRVMENGTEIRPRREADKTLAMRTFGLRGEKPVLLFVGQLNWKKNILRILEAAALLHSRGEDFTLVLAGQGPDEGEIRDKAAALGISDRTLLTGHITDTALLDGLYQCASLFVFPSLYDNAPMVLREAAVMGTPGVLVRGSTAAEAIRDGVNGLLARDDAGELADVLQANMRNSARLAELGENARAYIPVSWDDVVDRALLRYAALAS